MRNSKKAARPIKCFTLMNCKAMLRDWIWKNCSFTMELIPIQVLKSPCLKKNIGTLCLLLTKLLSGSWFLIWELSKLKMKSKSWDMFVGPAPKLTFPQSSPQEPDWSRPSFKEYFNLSILQKLDHAKLVFTESAPVAKTALHFITSIMIRSTNREILLSTTWEENGMATALIKLSLSQSVENSQISKDKFTTLSTKPKGKCLKS